VPEGTAAVCIARATGSFPIRTLTLDVGDRRPLGVGAGSLALLAAMPDAEIGRIIERNERWLRDYPGYTPASLRALVAQARDAAYAFNAGGIVPGMCAVGIPVLDADRRPIAALSVAAINERMLDPRPAQLARLLKREAKALGRQVGDARV
jgi:DNA-binding IclR family transcriptional regulator